MLLPQPRQRPRCQSHEATGTSSWASSVRSHPVQCERGVTTDSPRGQRETTTVQNDPTARPMTPASSVHHHSGTVVCAAHHLITMTS